MSLIYDILAAKRDAVTLTDEQLAEWVAGVADGRVSDAQIAAFCMAVAIRGMARSETVALTLAMRDSGARLDWSGLLGPVLDKHSSGGIGDKTSLILAPLLAACGAFVPMISGRGLGHTGGTLDKLESLEGYRVDADAASLRRCLERAGCAIVGASDTLAPADRRIYAVRDLTATVESLPLITASILSKKLAAGPQALVMDVKLGSGAFCPDLDAAQALARSIVETARGAGLPTRALISDMNQCLGRHAGNALEVAEALALLRGEDADARLLQLVLELAVELLCLGGLHADPAAARMAAQTALQSGAAFERFERMAHALGAVGLQLPPPAPVVRDVPALRDAGYVEAVDARAIGLAIIDLGGGRHQPGEAIDHRVGLAHLLPIGAVVDGPLARVHARSEADAQRAIAQVQSAYRIGERALPPPPLVHARI